MRFWFQACYPPADGRRRRHTQVRSLDAGTVSPECEAK